MQAAVRCSRATCCRRMTRLINSPNFKIDDEAGDHPVDNTETVASMRSEQTHHDTERHPADQHPGPLQVEDLAPIHLRSMQPRI